VKEFLVKFVANKKILHVSLTIFLIAVVFFPLIVSAGQYLADGHPVTYEGLVPCGKKVMVYGVEVEIPCQLCHFFVMIKNVLDFLLLPPTGVVFLVGVLMLVVAGLMFVFGNVMTPGDPKVFTDSRRIMSAAIVGLLIIFGAWLFVNVFFTIIGVAEWTGLRKGVFVMKCDVHLPEGFVPPAGNLALDSQNGDTLNVNLNESFDLGVNFDTQSPVNHMNVDVNFSNDLFVLTGLIPNTDDSNFNTFLPIDNDGNFNAQKVIQEANAGGTINFGATCFDFETGLFGDPQIGDIDSLVTLVFEAKNPGKGEVTIDSENSKLMAAIGNVLKKEDIKIEVIISE
jgi:hypothetical protein